MARKSADAFRTISEVAEWLDTPAHVLRFWESRFPQIKPVKRRGGRRYYRPADMQLIGGLKKLLHEDGLTIRGAQKVLREKGVKYVASLSPPLPAGLDSEDTGADQAGEAARGGEPLVLVPGPEVADLAGIGVAEDPSEAPVDKEPAEGRSDLPPEPSTPPPGQAVHHTTTEPKEPTEQQDHPMPSADDNQLSMFEPLAAPEAPAPEAPAPEAPPRRPRRLKLAPAGAADPAEAAGPSEASPPLPLDLPDEPEARMRALIAALARLAEQMRAPAA